MNIKKVFFRKRLLLGLAGIAIFFFIISKINLQQTARHIVSADPAWILLAVFFSLAGTILRSLKWKKLVESYGTAPSLFETTRIFCVGTMVGFLTPLKIGVFARAWFLKNIGLSKAIVTIIIDRGTELAFVAIIALLGSILFGIKFSIITGEKAVYIAIAVCLLAIITWFFGRTDKKIAAFVKDLLCLAKNKKTAATIIVLTPLPFVFSVLVYLSVSQAIGIQPASIGFFFFLTATATIVESLPITFLGLGTREAVLVLLLAQIGESSEIAVALSLLYLAINYSIVCALGISKLISSKGKENSISQIFG